MAGGATAAEPPVDGAAFELERFEWAAEDRIELAGRWLGVRGMRFIRPTLTLRGADGDRRLLALLEHKPWAVDDDELWIAAFAWEGDRASIDEAELAVASGLEVVLPAPRAAKPRRGQAAPRKAVRYDVRVPESEAKAAAPVAKRPKRAPKKPAASVRVEQLEAELGRLRKELANTMAQVERDAATRGRAEGERDEAVAAHEAVQAEADERRTELAAAGAELAALRAELAAAKSELAAALADRDAARADLKTAEAERAEAMKQRAAAVDERDAAQRERDALPRRSGLIAIRGDRGLSALAVWTPRLIAIAIFAVFVGVVALLFHAAL